MATVGSSSSEMLSSRRCWSMVGSVFSTSSGEGPWRSPPASLSVSLTTAVSISLSAVFSLSVSASAVVSVLVSRFSSVHERLTPFFPTLSFSPSLPFSPSTGVTQSVGGSSQPSPLSRTAVDARRGESPPMSSKAKSISCLSASKAARDSSAISGVTLGTRLSARARPCVGVPLAGAGVLPHSSRTVLRTFSWRWKADITRPDTGTTSLSWSWPARSSCSSCCMRKRYSTSLMLFSSRCRCSAPHSSPRAARHSRARFTVNAASSSWPNSTARARSDSSRKVSMRA
mmetsp:Transcript_3876/g.13699  ORF Transcript_3876/g.13699 Transcript_3876/m.13699 type:complete len:286 (-) Transcript_3876:1846-2703(-)